MKITARESSAFCLFCPFVATYAHSQLFHLLNKQITLHPSSLYPHQLEPISLSLWAFFNRRRLTHKINYSAMGGYEERGYSPRKAAVNQCLKKVLGSYPDHFLAHSLCNRSFSQLPLITLHQLLCRGGMRQGEKRLRAQEDRCQPLYVLMYSCNLHIKTVNDNITLLPFLEIFFGYSKAPTAVTEQCLFQCVCPL